MQTSRLEGVSWGQRMVKKLASRLPRILNPKSKAIINQKARSLYVLSPIALVKIVDDQIWGISLIRVGPRLVIVRLDRQSGRARVITTAKVEIQRRFSLS